MKHFKSTLPNGLRVLVTPLGHLESLHLLFGWEWGERQEANSVAGLSHFLEHMVFKGSKKRPSAREISESVDAIGAEVNAGTSKEWTNFYIRARASHLAQAFDILSDMVIYPLIPREEIKKEKRVILEEISMYNDTPSAKIGHLFEQLIFSGNSLGRNILVFKQSAIWPR